MDIHTWITPEALADRLGAHPCSQGWATCCPCHGGDNPRAFTIRRGTDRHGNPCTLLYCHTHHCPIEDICVALDLPLPALFAVHPDYARRTRTLPRTHSPRIERLRKGTVPADQDDLGQLMLEEMIASDPQWIQECVPARQTLWVLAQASPRAKHAFTAALVQAHLTPALFWTTLEQDMKGP